MTVLTDGDKPNEWGQLTKAQRRNRHKKQVAAAKLIDKNNQKRIDMFISEECHDAEKVKDTELKHNSPDTSTASGNKFQSQIPVNCNVVSSLTCIKNAKKRPRVEHDEENGVSLEQVPERLGPNYPYEVDGDDHCETPIEAYIDILPLLDGICAALGKSRSNLQIYDPYFCEGAMRKHLECLGFTQVYNVCEDFYARVAANTVPSYDVLITNPPYSGSHVEQLLKYVSQSGLPFLLLLPNYFYMKDYYWPSLRRDMVGMNASNQLSSQPAMKTITPFYLSPQRRYQYTTPKGRRQAKSAKYTAPFPSFWYCSLGDSPRLAAALSHNRLRQLYVMPTNTDAFDSARAESDSHTEEHKSDPKRLVHLALRLSELPLAVLPENDPRKKTERNDRKRIKHAQRKALKMERH